MRLVVLISDPPLTKIRSSFVCISLCRERKSLVRIGDSLGIELYFAFKDNVAIAATASGLSGIIGESAYRYIIYFLVFTIGPISNYYLVKVIFAPISRTIGLQFARMTVIIKYTFCFQQLQKSTVFVR